jgi:hypothetical protein
VFLATRNNGLRILNATDPASPFEVGYWETPGEAWSVQVLGDYAYVADWETGLRIVNISDPYSPIEQAFYEIPCRFVTVEKNIAFMLTIEGLFIIRNNLTTDVKDIHPYMENPFTIYPNPVTNSFTLSTAQPLPDHTQLSLSDIKGVQILNRQITEPQSEIDVSFLPAGIYLLKVSDENSVQIEKIIKQ